MHRQCSVFLQDLTLGRGSAALGGGGWLSHWQFGGRLDGSIIGSVDKFGVAKSLVVE